MIKVMWAYRWDEFEKSKADWKKLALDKEKEIETLKSKIRDYERKLGAKDAEIDNLQAELSKSKRNDSPKDAKSGKFIKKKGAK